MNHHHIDLIDTTEMFLRTIWELEEEGVTPLRARIAERLGQSGPTVSQTVARMERDGLVHVESDRHLVLTETGRRRAVAVMRKHRLAERLLSDVIGLEWEQLHIEACRWEHVMSEAVERRILTLLDHPLVCPHGNPIPGLDLLGVPVSNRPLDDEAPAGSTPGPLADRLPTLAASVAGDEVTVRIERISESLQPDADVMRQLSACGLTPGVSVAVSRKPDGLHVAGAGAAEPVPEEIAEHIFVSVSA
ncbi:MAG: metal-dependent transcriptional regulator [Jatrophihabitantaceae bacterium]